MLYDYNYVPPSFCTTAKQISKTYGPKSVVHLKERGGGQNFSISFWMRFRQVPLCRYEFKVIFDNIIFFTLGQYYSIYICFWRFNSTIMTWNKWLVFTKISYHVIEQHITLTLPVWRCLITVRIIRPYLTPPPDMQVFGVEVWLSLHVP